ncbi:hypothetical protein RIF29_25194 [Crotalaria pallida]|uniref:Uncharacterized protein n=1 Tax=Crotalaria pallida TaxID=3830 RepID=A0AAN9I0V7_CROPI
MNSCSLTSSFLISPPICKFHPQLQIKLQPTFHHLCGNGVKLSSSISMTRKSTMLIKATDSSSNIDAPVALPEDSASDIPIEEIIEKDWSVLDFDISSSREQFKRNIGRVISAGRIGEGSSVLVSTASEEFVDCLVDSTRFKSLLVIHDSLLTLVCIKEKYDKVKCWQGEVIYVPERWTPLDVVFLYFLPALPFKLDEILGALAKKCSPGGRVIISHPQGREVLEQQRQQYPDIVVSDLPDKTNLQMVAAARSFDVAEFVDEPGFYLVVLVCSEG